MIRRCTLKTIRALTGLEATFSRQLGPWPRGHVLETFLRGSPLPPEMGGVALVVRHARVLARLGQGAMGVRPRSGLDRRDLRRRAAGGLRASRREAESGLPCAERVFRSAGRACGRSIRGGRGHDEPQGLGPLRRHGLRRGLPEKLGSAPKALCGRVAEAVYYEREAPVLEGAMFFHATYIKPDWARGKRPLARIGGHVFYK